MKRMFIRICAYLFNSKQTGWKEVMLHDAAMLLLFFAITQTGSIALLVRMHFGIGPREQEETVEDVLFFMAYFSTLIAVVYGCVLILRFRDYWLTSEKPLNNGDKTQGKRSSILFPTFWKGIQDRVNQFRWWECYLYLPISLPVMVFAAACLFPALAALSVVLVILAYSYLSYTGTFSPNMEMLARWGKAFLIGTAGMYVVLTLGFIEASVKSRLGLSECDSTEQDSDANA